MITRTEDRSLAHNLQCNDSDDSLSCLRLIPSASLPNLFSPEDVAATTPTVFTPINHTRSERMSLDTAFGSRPISPPPVLAERLRGETYAPPSQRSWRYISAEKCREQPGNYRPPRLSRDLTGHNATLHVTSRKLANSSRYFTATDDDHPVIHEGETLWLEGGIFDYWLVGKKVSEHGDYSLMSVIQGRHRLTSIVAALHEKVAAPRIPGPIQKRKKTKGKVKKAKVTKPPLPYNVGIWASSANAYI
ncbi:hypothetical protein DFH06DRAFT_1343485 [Mycena polygramma]|nr:hypothetical protein DFH06DRAFT_1343485 [Mycena polygramma]